jgi:hypothetical protein
MAALAQAIREAVEQARGDAAAARKIVWKEKIRGSVPAYLEELWDLAKQRFSSPEVLKPLRKLTHRREGIHRSWMRCSRSWLMRGRIQASRRWFSRISSLVQPHR